MTHSLSFDAGVDFYEDDEPIEHVLAIAGRPVTHESTAPLSVLDVAAALLRRFGRLDTYKLQKLCYYAQAQHLAMYNTRLFHEPIVAWPNGPVVRELFARHAGRREVESLGVGDAAAVTNEPAAAETLDFVADRYGVLSGKELSELTHREQPWRDAREGLRPKELGQQEVSVAVLRDYYRSLEPPEAEDDPEDWWNTDPSARVF